MGRRVQTWRLIEAAPEALELISPPARADRRSLERLAQAWGLRVVQRLDSKNRPHLHVEQHDPYVRCMARYAPETR